MRIGCLFGTFDPPHKGHLAIADHMLATQGLDQVWLVVTPLNPFKQDRPISPDQHRLAMVRLAVMGHDGIQASGLELELPKPNYTVDSLRFMRQRWPEHRFDLIIGSDNLAVLHKWKNAEEILEHHRVLVYPRTGFHDHLASTIFHGHPAVRAVADAPMLPYSSTDVRADIVGWHDPARAGQVVEDQVDAAVVSYIRQHGLYKP